MIEHAFFSWFSLGPTELLIVGVVALLVFGRRLPEVGKSLGKGIVEFKKGLHGLEEEIETAGEEEPDKEKSDEEKK